ncbi:MAG TPA: ATP-binding protein [Tepidisphaeraceae bacterium]|jgi:signal transduction histidine kinase
MKQAQFIWSLLVIALTAAVVWLTWSHLKTYLRNDHQVVLAREAQRGLFEMTIWVQDTENGARGYLLTGRPEFKAKYMAALQNVDTRMQAAENTIGGVDLLDPFHSVRGLLEQRLVMLGQMVALTDDGKRPEAVAMLESDPVLQNATSIREQMIALLSNTDERLQQRLTVCRDSTVVMTRWVLVGVASLVLASTALVWLLRREYTRQKRIAAELAVARDAAVAGTKARDEFLNVLSHELRTPLTPALACVSLLQRNAQRGSELHDDLTMIRRQLELEARLIDDLLNVGQVLRGELTLRRAPVSVHTLLRQALESCQEEITSHQLRLEVHLDAGSDRVSGDEPRLHLVVWHLLTNAVKFTPKGGSVSVRTDNAPGRISITVSDTGIGMSDEQMKSLFEPFKQGDSSLTRRFGGLGIGLAICRRVIELHGGSIDAESRGKDQGSTFTVVLPLAEIMVSTTSSAPPSMQQLHPAH